MLTSATERDALAASFTEVAEQSFFAYAEAAEPAPEDVAACGDWLQAYVRFTGPFEGDMRLTIPTSLGYELCGAFLGCGPEEALADSAVSDLVGELANMACGAWLTNTHSAKCFALTHPEVSRVTEPPASHLLWLSCNGQPVSVALELEASAS